jgi:hypothetical protein
MRATRGLPIVLTAVALLVTDAAVTLASGEHCAAAKIAAVRRKTSMKLNCYRRAAASGEDVDTSCLARAEARFALAFAAAERKYECVKTQDAEALEMKVDDFAADVFSELPATTTTSTSTSSSSSPPPTTCGAPGIGCSGSCPSGSFCTILQDCFCGGQAHCVCSSMTFTTCTVPPNCPTTTTLP